MAEIQIERKDTSIWPWILGILLLALLIWGIYEALDDDTVDLPVAVAPLPAPPLVDEVQPLPPAANPPTPIAQAAGIPVSQIIESPATWTGRTVNGEVRVGEVVSDRGFWITDQGERLFVVINENVNTPGETINIEANQTLRIREAVVYRGDQLATIPGTLEPQARNIAQGQPVVLVADGRNINILGQAGT
jgi:hypothetical protein